MSYEYKILGKIVDFKDEESFLKCRLEFIQRDDPLCFSFVTFIMNNIINNNFGVEGIREEYNLNENLSTWTTTAHGMDWNAHYNNYYWTSTNEDSWSYGIDPSNNLNSDYSAYQLYTYGGDTTTEIPQEMKEIMEKEEKIRKEREKFTRFDIMDLD